MNLWLSLNKALTLYADKTAIVDGSKTFTYAQVGKRIAGLGAHLVGEGLKQGDVVAMLAPNCHEYYESYYACGVTGIVMAPLNYRLVARELSQILQDADTRVLIAHTDFAEHVPEIVEECTDLQRIIWVGDGNKPSTTIPSRDFEDCVANGSLDFYETIPYLRADDLAHLYYTSGTTGTPKGVMLTQGNVAFNALAVVADLFIKEQDVWLHAAPLFHLADAWATFSITWVGGTHVFNRYFDAVKALKTIEQQKVTLTVLVPTMLNAMLNEHDTSAEPADYSSWRMVLTGGSPIAPDMVRRATQTFGCEYIQLYGMTETSPFLTLSKPKGHQLDWDNEKQLPVRAKTGRPYIGAEVKVVNTDGQRVANNDLDVGQIVARGPSIFAGYWKKPEATAHTLQNGWIQTGDLATVDAEGFINIVDRAKDMIITGGENVYSTEVEYALHEHPAVHECAVFGVPDSYWGESVKAVVVCRSRASATESELIEFLKERLAGYKVPRSIDFITELPKTGSGKIYKKGLREQYWKDSQKQVN